MISDYSKIIMKKNKKLIFVLFPILLLGAGCGNTTDLPADIYNYLKQFSFNKTYANTNQCVLTSLYQEFDKDGNLIGEKKEDLNFSKTEENEDLRFDYICQNFGNQVEANDGLNIKETTLFTNNSGKYEILKTENGKSILNEELIFQDAYSYMISLFYTNDSPYRYGGLYYGDYFQINSHTFGLNYKIKDDFLYFESKNDENFFEDAIASQIIAINNNGMLVYCNQTLTNTVTGNYATLLLEATYKK